MATQGEGVIVTVEVPAASVPGPNGPGMPAVPGTPTTAAPPAVAVPRGPLPNTGAALLALVLLAALLLLLGAAALRSVRRFRPVSQRSAL